MPDVAHDPADALDEARAAQYEQPARALMVADACHDVGRAMAEPALCARARALQAAVMVHRGDVPQALGLILEAERHAEATTDPVARAETNAITGLVGFFSGSHATGIAAAERAVHFAELAGDPWLQIYVGRVTCPIYANVAVDDLERRLRTTLALAVEVGDPWEEAMSRNDLACFAQDRDLTEAHAEIERALACVATTPGPNRFGRAVLHSTRADLRLATAQPAEALHDAQCAIRLLMSDEEPNPYVLAVTVRAEIQARVALGQLADARSVGEESLRWLGDRVPRIRSLILTTLAQELRTAGCLEDAYDALHRSAELERQAFQELSGIQVALERSRLEAQAAREEAERDWLTGLHNRRHLARTLSRSGPDPLARPVAIAVLDLDQFKAVNDRFGHATGDDVLQRIARLLRSVLREQDILVRSGGEEFLILMPETDLRTGTICCERIRRTIEQEDWSTVATGLTLTASVGLATAGELDEVEAIAAVADERLYEAKRQGRNRIVAEPVAPTV